MIRTDIDNLKDVPALLAHAVKMSKEDIEKMSGYNISVSHCPISNLKLGCGVANITEMLKQGVNVSFVVEYGFVRFNVGPFGPEQHFVADQVL